MAVAACQLRPSRILQHLQASLGVYFLISLYEDTSYLKIVILVAVVKRDM